MDCLGMPLILKTILEDFSISELLQLSLVNKLWNHEARCLLKSRGDLTRRINQNDACEDLRDFAVDLRLMKVNKRVVPISGLTTVLGGDDWSHGDWCKESSAADLDQVYQDILDEISWKNLSVKFLWGWEKCKNCPAFILLKKIFQKHSSTLEQLSLCLQKDREFASQILQENCSFSSLKTLRFLRRYPPFVVSAIRSEATDLIKCLVSAAPNLKVLYTEERVDLGANLLEGSSAVHVTDYDYAPGFDEIPENVLHQLRMQRMRFCSSSQQFSMERFNSITSKWLQISGQTLSSLEIAAIFLVPLTRYRICLENVRTLRVTFTKGGLEICQPALWRLVKSFDFKRIFPNVNTVDISWIHDMYFLPTFNEFHYMIEEENVAFVEPMSDRAENIKTLSLQWFGGILDSSTQFLVHMFPDIQRLEVRTKQTPSSGIWDCWPNLKELDINFEGCSTDGHFDGFFCGIFPEEVAQLRERDDEYLRRVNIVPVMSSIIYLKGLRTLNLSTKVSRLFRGQIDDPATLVISKVTALIAFQRLPALAVTLTTFV